MRLRQRLLLLLGDPEVSDREFKELKAWLMQGGLADCLDEASAIRRILRRSEERPSSERYELRPTRTSDPAVEQVWRLLRSDAGMTAKLSLALLAELLGSRRSFPDKTSFSAGVKRLIGEFGGSEVVAAAHQIRNREAHDPSSPSWPLRHGR